ncbi:LOW QUALITY PROTEIN: hypothetical protein U9M48_036172, partial [Paspalum notatum var. saurae]
KQQLVRSSHLPKQQPPTSAPCPTDGLGARSPRARGTGGEAEVAAAADRERAAADRSDGGTGGKAGGGGTGSSKGGSGSSGGGGRSACSGSELEARAAQHQQLASVDGTDEGLGPARDATRERTAQWADTQPHERGGGSPDRRGRTNGAPGGGARGGRAPGGGGSPDGRGRADGAPGGGGDRGLHGRRGSPSPDRYRDHHGYRAIVGDVGPGGGWPTLTKTNYVEWAAVMRVRLQVRHMWEAVRYGDVDYYEDRRAPDALIAAVPPKMRFSLSKSGLPRRPGTPSLQHASAATVPARPHRQHFARSGRTWPSSRVRTLMTLLSVSTLACEFGDDTYDEERAVQKLFRCIPEKYKQIARSIESLLDLSTMSIEEAIGRLKVVDSDEVQPPSGPINIGGKLYLTREQWEACQGDGKKGESSSATGDRKRKPRKGRKRVQTRAQGRAEGDARGGAQGGAAGNQKPARDDPCRNCGKLGHWAKECRQPRRGQAHVAQVEEEEPALLLAHASIEPLPAASATANLLHLDEPKAHAFLGDGSSDDKADGWCLDTGATHHMTGRREFFTELDSTVRGSVKFGDASGVEIKGVGSVLFTASGEHRLLTGVYYIPALRNSIISLGQLDENGSRVVIESGVLRIWDHHRRLPRGTNRLYVLNVQVAQPFCLAARRDDEAWQWHERFGHLHFEALKRLSANEMVRGLPCLDHVEQLCDVCVLTKQRRLPFPHQSSFRAKERLELVHGDLCGPVTPATPGGRRYFLLLVDDLSRYMWVMVLGSKGEAADAIGARELLRRRVRRKLRVPRTDNGGEFTAAEFASYRADEGIRRHYSAPYSPRRTASSSGATGRS